MMTKLTRETLADWHFPGSHRELLGKILELCAKNEAEVLVSEYGDYFVIRRTGHKDSKRIPIHREYLLTTEAILGAMTDG